MEWWKSNVVLRKHFHVVGVDNTCIDEWFQWLKTSIFQINKTLIPKDKK